MDQSDFEGLDEPRPSREPLFNAPWTIVALSVGLVGLYLLQSLTLSEADVDRLALSPRSLQAGAWQGLIVSMFLHGGWAHVLMNALGAFAFGPPTARLMGTRPRGASAFFAFYLTCGILAGLGYVAVNLNDVDPVVGASGAVSGLLGAASRLI